MEELLSRSTILNAGQMHNQHPTYFKKILLSMEKNSFFFFFLYFPSVNHKYKRTITAMKDTLEGTYNALYKVCDNYNLKE